MEALKCWDYSTQECLRCIPTDKDLTDCQAFPIRCFLYAIQAQTVYATVRVSLEVRLPPHALR